MNRIIIILIALSIALLSNAQSDAYQQAMGNAMEQLKQAEETRDFTGPANTFERIAAAAPEGAWLPFYYQAYCQLMLGVKAMENQEMDRLDAHLKKAQSAIEKALAAAPQEAEVHALQGYIYTGNIWSDPQAEGPQYAPKSIASYKQAMALQEDNPRPYHLMGVHLFYTPEFWGGGPAAALPYLEKANERFASFEPASELHPTWGKHFNDVLLQQAQPAAGDK